MTSQEKKKGVPLCRSPKHWIYFKTTMSISCCYFFCHSSSNSVSIPVKCVWYLHSLLIILHICLLPVACFELPIIRTFFDFPRRFELSGVDCSSKWRIQDGGGFQFLIYVIKNVIMTSLLFLKVINVLATFLISWDTLIYYDFFASWLLWKESGYCQSIQQYDVIMTSKYVIM